VRVPRPDTTAPVQPPRQFDSIATVYDSTRDPLDPETIEKLGEALRSRGVRKILEVGVGTGRVAVPLQALGFDVTGLDASVKMLARASAKGLARTLRGNAYRLPFFDQSFDAGLFVHVLHLLEDVPGALAEASRVARHGAWALVHPGAADGTASRGSREAWDRVYEILVTRGFPIPTGRGAGPRVRERAVLERFPPSELVPLTDRMVTESYAKSLNFLAHGGSRHTLHVPKEALEEAVRIARQEMGDRTFQYREIESLAIWPSFEK